MVGFAAVLFSKYYWAIFIVGLGAGLAGWGIVHVVPKQYTSSVYLRLDEAAARNADAVMSAAPILDQVLARVDVPGSTIEDRRRRLDAERSLSVAPNEIARTGSPFRMEVTDQDPPRARQLNAAFLDAWLTATKPAGDKKALLDQQIERAERELKWTFDSIEQAGKDPATAGMAAVVGPALLGSPMAALVGRYEEIGTTLEKRREQAQGVSRDVILSEPTLPEEPSSPRPLQTIALAVVGAELLLLLGLIAREKGWLRRG
jgi:hypothetical protein